MRKSRVLFALLLAAVAATGVVPNATAQQSQQGMSASDRDHALSTLHEISGDIKKHYYDPNFHGLNVDSLFKQAEEEMKASISFNQAITHLAVMLDKFDDSHLFYQPPPRPYKLDYGWRMRMIGDKCYVTAVRPGTDAEKKGLKPGDQVLDVNGFAPDRDSLWKIQYLYNSLRPQPGLKLSIVSPGGHPRELAIAALTSPKPKLQNISLDNVWALINEQQAESRIFFEAICKEVGGVLVCKVPEFALNPAQVEDLLRRMGDHGTTIFDLRENPGGSADTLERLLGGLFDHEIKVADRRGRKDMKSVRTHPHGKGYSGKCIVLVDSQSASASEVFARVLQLEKRGTVVGDRSEGAVMEAEGFSYSWGTNPISPTRMSGESYSAYGASITRANLIMADGKSLEKTGVTPDELLLPTPEDLAAGRDPVLAHALDLAGVKMSPEEAGKMFPYRWPK